MIQYDTVINVNYYKQIKMFWSSRCHTKVAWGAYILLSQALRVQLYLCLLPPPGDRASRSCRSCQDPEANPNPIQKGFSMSLTKGFKRNRLVVSNRPPVAHYLWKNAAAFWCSHCQGCRKHCQIMPNLSKSKALGHRPCSWNLSQG